MSGLRLLAIIEAYSITGPAKNLLEFARLSRDAGVETTLATFTRGEDSNLFIETARRDGISIEAIRERGAYDTRIVSALQELADRVQPDIIQTHAVKSHFLIRRAKLHRAVPWVAFHHGYTWTSRQARLRNQLDRWSLRAARQVATVSVPFREELVVKGVLREKIEIVHNAIPPEWGTTREPGACGKLREKLGIGPECKVILSVGRLSLEKNHVMLLEAVCRLPSRQGWHLVIVGEGPERPAIEERIRTLNLSSAVTLTGQQDSAEPYYGIADIAVLSSRSEGSPNALLEAMAAGVPVVATRVGGIPEIVTHGESALLVESGDSPALMEAISGLFLDTALGRQLAARSQELIRDKHAPVARMRKLIAIYQTMLKSPV